MTIPLKTIEVDFNKKHNSNAKKIVLNSGRQIVAHSKGDEELLEIREADDRILLEVRLTQSGPVISVKGARLELSAMEEISLDARKINIHSEEQTRITSQGGLAIDTRENIDIKSREDIKLESKVIHLN
jgi:hypothetical protein